MPAALVGEAVGAPAVVVGWAPGSGGVVGWAPRGGGVVGWAPRDGGVVGCAWFAGVGFASAGRDGCAPTVDSDRDCPSGAIDGPLGPVSCERLVQPGARVASARAATMAEMRRTEADFWFRVIITVALPLTGERRYILAAGLAVWMLIMSSYRSSS